MSYTKNTWKTGDTITADKLNHMEDGIAVGGGAFIGATVSGNTTTLTKTYAEIVNAAQSGALPFLVTEGTYSGEYNIKLIDSYGSGEVNGTFSCFVHFANDDYDYNCLSENDYPVHSGIN